MTVDTSRPGRRLGVSLRVLRLVWSVSPPTVGAVVLLTVVAGLLPAYQVQLTAAAVQAVADAITAGGSEAAVDRALRAGLMLAALSVGSTVLGSVQGYAQAILQIHLANRMNERILSKAVALDLQHFENDQYYDSLQRASREAGVRPYQIFSSLIGAGGTVVTLVSMLAVLFSWDPVLGLCLLASPIPALVANLVFGRRSFRIEHQRAAERRRIGYLQQLMTSDKAFKEIRLLQLEPLFMVRYRAAISRFFTVDRGLIRRQTLVNLPLTLLSVAVSAGAVLYAMVATISVGLVGQFTGFVQAVGRVQTSANVLVATIGQLYKDALFVGNLFEFLELPESQIVGGSRPFPRRLVHGIEFRDVTFVYPGTTRVALDRLSCVIPAGKCVAVVGANGAGKTTLVKLLARLYEPTAGQILVDGAPIEEYDLAGLRRSIGVIFQDFVKYELSVLENIGFGSIADMRDRDRVRLAAEQSRAADFIDRLPDGYDTTLGRMFANGHQLSGGQWQKIALARAFMRQAPLVVLDEPTAAIDAEAEAEIFGRLREIAHNATALLIAHRFSTVRLADHIVVLDQGRLIEEGSHEELLLAEGTYARLFMLQATGYLEGVETGGWDGGSGHRARHAQGPDETVLGPRLPVGPVPAGPRTSAPRLDGHGPKGLRTNGHGTNGYGMNGHHGAESVPRPRHASPDEDEWPYRTDPVYRSDGQYYRRYRTDPLNGEDRP
ncbi:ABC transporter ATP-binding protein [Jidongwangia harbinensis]|uniref:ABC transporter ATP-binding protein n=1 Tax=Jidongwangia harbinensis TaxID=2878561 RepID=UPI001CDA0507|nr:ABC transporter ATP-binding protein [Jidongwangia harbinensis]MCA2215061.1 ABC transporter ATP-binding protein/permease [Jidongwangia harbinensis]